MHAISREALNLSLALGLRQSTGKGCATLTIHFETHRLHVLLRQDQVCSMLDAPPPCASFLALPLEERMCSLQSKLKRRLDARELRGELAVQLVLLAIIFIRKQCTVVSTTTQSLFLLWTTLFTFKARLDKQV